MKSKNAKSLLMDENPLIVLPRLATTVGLQEALILQQLHFLLQNPKNGKKINGERYIYNTYPEWRTHFPFWSAITIGRHFRELEKRGLVKSTQPDQKIYNQRKYYRIDYDVLDELDAQPEQVPVGQTNGSHGVDQSDTLREDQIDPLYIQRLPESIPPTPEQELRGYPSFPGKKGSLKPRPKSKSNGSRPGISSEDRQSWYEMAMADPVAQEFLELTGLREFPKSGRQQLARAFVGRRQSGQMSLSSVRLINAVKSLLNTQSDPAQLLKNFPDTLVEAREAAEELLEDIESDLNRPGSDLLSLIQLTASADAAWIDPDQSLSAEMSLPFPRSILFAVGLKRGLDLTSHSEALRSVFLHECSNDSGIAPFLRQIGVELESLGITESEIESGRNALRQALEGEAKVLRDLLTEDSKISP